jgi:alpha-galactosidase
MGWNSWNAFGPTIDAAVVREMADALVSTGLRDLGYRYLVIDDGWSRKSGRDTNGDLVPDPDRFPDGIAPLAAHAHERGLLLGIYSDAAELTCARHPGSYGFEDRDAALWATWGIDFLKYDYCHAPPDRAAAIERYSTMRLALDGTGSEILLSICEWGEREPHRWAREVGGQMWRVSGDVVDTWGDLASSSTDFGIVGAIDRAADLADFAGPGGWNDLDMLVVGLEGRGYVPGTGAALAEYRTQVSMWSLLASPLMIGCDIRSMSTDSMALLSNPRIIAIDQDPLGVPAKRVGRRDDVEIWRRPLAGGRIALGLLNRSSAAVDVELPANDFGDAPPGVFVDAWIGDEVGGRWPLVVPVGPHDTAVLTTA